MNTLITSPRKPMSDVDAQIECEFAIDLPVREFIDAIVQAGWTPEVAYAAMRDVVDNQALAYAEHPDHVDEPARRSIYG
ncbi:hypothetical protein [Shinella sp. BE166]|uniref:hypothetical protein n=1 Tax=unclassified Shinella TaxID=2643062 RepID=UPI003EB8533E